MSAEKMITIRNAKIDEFHELEEISVSSMSEPWREADFMSAEKNEYALILAAVEEDVKTGDNDDLAVYADAAALDAGNPVGYAVGYFAADEAELPSIAVSPQMRRHGIGDALLNELFNQVKARGAAKLFLEVRESNEAAIALYEKNGFITAGTRRHFYSNPEEDALVMMKLL